MHRRRFIECAGLALCGLSAGGAHAGNPSRDQRVRVAVVGTGVRGQQLIEFLQRLPEFEVAACCDVLPFRLAEAQALTGGSSEAFDDHRRALDDKSIDAVVIATPFSHHLVASLDALSAGKHVYCEKTMVKGIPGTLRLVRAARKADRIFQTGFQYHASPLYRTAVEMIRRGDLGDVAAIDCQWNRNGDWRRPVPDPALERQINWRMYREFSGGLAAELSAHQMDFCNRVLPGGVETVSGTGGIDFWRDGRETYDNIQLACRYREGVTATFSSLTTNSLGGYRISVLGSKGAIELSTRRGWFYPEISAGGTPEEVDLVSGASVDGASGSWRLADAGVGYRIDSPEDDPTPLALRQFARSIVDNRQPESGVETGARVSIMVQMALDAMDHRIVSHWSDVYDMRA